MQIPDLDRNADRRPLIGLTEPELYAYGHLIRSTERRILDLFGRGLLSGTTHTCLGQELAQIAVVRALDQADDVILSNHRNHGHFLAYSRDVLGLIAEVMGRQAGVCGGYGGSQHIAFRHFHSNGVQAGMTAIGVGLALARKLSGSPAVVGVMVGDGTLGEGLLYESINLASIWKCKVLFVVEHNGIAQTTETSHTIGGTIEARGPAFGLPTRRLDDAMPNFCAEVNDVVVSLRNSDGPAMLVIDTRRMGPHSKGDDLRPREEMERIARRDPLAAMARNLDPAVRTSIEESNVRMVDCAEAEAMLSPEATFDAAPSHAFRPATEHSKVPDQPPAAPNVRQALNRALRDLLERDPRVLLLGEDLHEPYGGAFKVTAGLSTAFRDRVISTPISEAGVMGAGIGLAMHGMRPIVEVMFADFLTLGMDQIYNHAVKFPGMFPEVSVPLVVRTPVGGRRGYGPTHSQNPENLMVSVPGLTVVFGSHRHNCGQLLVNAVQRWPNPTIFLEHKLLYGETQDGGDYSVVRAHPDDLGTSLFPTLRRGAGDPDLTFVTFGGMLPIVERAARALEKREELRVEIVAPALLAPLPARTLCTYLLERPRIVVVEESHHAFGVSAEILAQLAEAGYSGRIKRVGTAPVPIASARSLERTLIPGEDEVVAAALEII